MGLLDEIRSDLVNESASLPNILRKAKILASALGVPEFREWVDCELGGYQDKEKVPSYRRFTPTNLGDFAGPFQSGVKNMVLPTYNLPPGVKDLAENMIFFEGVGALAARGSDAGQIKWPQEAVMLAREVMQMQGGMVLVDAHQPVPAYLMPGILDQVKTKLLDFVLGLQENHITAKDLDNRTVATDVARNLFQIYIYGDRNIVASGEHVNQQVNPVEKGDLESLLNRIRELGIDEEDVHELDDAVQSEPEAPEGRLGPKVKGWLGGMISKAASSTWNVGLEFGSKALTDALNGYYGC